MKLDSEEHIAVGKLGVLRFREDYYIYIGSALGGLRARLRHHLGIHEKLHWHIDYFLRKAVIRNIVYGRTEETLECAIAQKLSLSYSGVPGFGCSDCLCSSHLFYTGDPLHLYTMVENAFNFAGVQPFVI